MFDWRRFFLCRLRFYRKMFNWKYWLWKVSSIELADVLLHVLCAVVCSWKQCFVLFCGCYMAKKPSKMFALCDIKWVKNAQFAVLFCYQNMSFQQIAAYIKHDCHFDSPYRILCSLILMSVAKVNHKSTENIFFRRPLIFIIKNQMWLQFAIFTLTNCHFSGIFLDALSLCLLIAFVCHIHSLRMCACVCVFASIFYNDKCDKLELINSHKKQQQILARI